jgi:ethanolamine utilization cobalamin adenosyltransferase
MISLRQYYRVKKKKRDVNKGKEKTKRKEGLKFVTPKIWRGRNLRRLNKMKFLVREN